MLLDAQQEGTDKGTVVIANKPMYKLAAPSDGITPVVVDAHAGVWLVLLLVTIVAGWVIGDLLHTASQWLIGCLTSVLQPMAALFSSLISEQPSLNCQK